MRNKSLFQISLSDRRALSRWVLALPLLAAAAIFTGCSAGVDADSPMPSVTASNVTLTAEQRQHIRVYSVRSSEFHETIDVTGTVDFDQDQATAVLAPFSGPVTQLTVLLGQHVKAGDPLAKADSPDFATAISAYRKAVATSKTSRELADLDQRLLSHHGVSQREASQAESDAINAEADRDAALQQLIALKVDPQTIRDIQEGRPISHAEGIIRSPLTGVVVERQITPGQLLQAGTTPCFTVADLSRVWVMAHLFGSDLGSVSLGDPAEVLTGIGTNSISGTVDNISANVDPDTRSILVRVVAENPGEILKKNMYVRVRIRSRRATSGLLVPVSAILRDSEELPFVYRVQPNGSFARQPVTLGSRVEDQYDVTSGLKSGDEIVTEGGLFVQFLQVP